MALDFSAGGTPVEDAPDFSRFGTPVDSASPAVAKPEAPAQPVGDEFTMLRDQADAAPSEPTPAPRPAPAFDPNANPTDALALDAAARKAAVDSAASPPPSRPGPTIEAAQQLQRDAIQEEAAQAQPAIAAAKVAYSKPIKDVEGTEKPLVSDVANLLISGGVMAAQDTSELVRKGMEAAGGTPAKLLNAVGDAAWQKIVGRTGPEALGDVQGTITSNLSGEQQKAQSDAWWDAKTNSFGPAWSEPRAYMGGVLQSIPEQVMMMAPAGAMARTVFAAKAAIFGEETAAKMAAKAAVLTGAVTEGSLGGAQSSRQVRDDIMAMSFKDLDGSEAYKSLVSSGLSPENARQKLAEDGASQAFVLGGIATGLFSGVGDLMLARAVTKGLEGNILVKFIKGAAAEGVEEYPQNFWQQVAQNFATQKAQPNKQLLEDAVNQGLQGAATAMVQGGATGIIASHVGETAPPQVAAAEAAKQAALGKWQAFNDMLRQNPKATPEEVHAAAKDLPPLDFEKVQPPAAPALDLVPREAQGAPAADNAIDMPVASPLERADAVESAIAQNEAAQRARAEGIDFQPTTVPGSALALASEGAAAARGNEVDIHPFLRELALLKAANIPAGEWLGQGDLLGRPFTAETQGIASGIEDIAARNPAAAADILKTINEFKPAKESERATAAPETLAPAPDARAAQGREEAGREPATAGAREGEARVVPEAVAPDFSAQGTPIVDHEAHAAATSPENALPQPTEGQKDAGNYQKGHVTIAGMDVSIENPAGSKRRPEWPTLKSHYGYIRGTEGADGEHVDAFVKPGTDPNWSGPVFVVDQVNPKGKFDEHKVVLGATSIDEARKLYAENYTKGFKVGPVTQMTLEQFKAWKASPYTKRAVKSLSLSEWRQINGEERAPTAEIAPETEAQADTAPGMEDFTKKGEVKTFAKQKQAKNYRVLAGLPKSWEPRQVGRGQWVLSRPQVVARERTVAQKANDAALGARAKSIQPTDDLFTQLDKGGGVLMSEVDGADPADMQTANRADYAKPFRKTRGMTLDGAAEFLAQHGWDTLDEDGRVDASKALDLIHQAIHEGPLYSAEGMEARAAATPTERREDTATRKRVAAMSPDEMRKALLTDELTGLGNRRAYEESLAAKPWPHHVAIDSDGLKWVNDNMGHAAGDELLRAIGTALRDEGLDAYHISGDEFAVRAEGEDAAVEAMNRVRERLAKARIEATMKDGSTAVLEGVGYSYGTGETPEAADRDLGRDKDERAWAGARAGRGEPPPELARRPAVEARRPQSDAPAARPKVAAEEAPHQALELKGETEAEIRAREAQQAKAAEAAKTREAAPAPEDFTLTGSARPVDEARARGQLELAQAEPAKTTKNEDVGENLWYNRRNFTGRALTWDEVKGLNDSFKVKEVVKAKVWPRPNYEQLVAEGLQPVFARIVKQVYDGVATAPDGKTDADLERYISVVNRVREGVFEWIHDAEMRRTMVAAITKEAENRGKGRVSLISMMGKNDELKRFTESLVDRIWPGEMQKSRYERFARGSETLAEARALGGNRALKALQVTLDDLLSAQREVGEGWPAPQEAWQRQGLEVAKADDLTPVYYEGKRTDGTPYVAVTIKMGDRRIVETVVNGATSQSDASVQDFVKGELAKIQGKHVLLDKGGRAVSAHETEDAAKEAARAAVKRESKGADLRGMNVADATRTGPARRAAGDDVSAQRLMDDFGFRGVNFGRESYINQAERQAYLNHAYDGLHDLAEVMGVTPKALSLNGMLGLAFGAQGRGGFAAAHFVPGVNEINLTKTMGAGTLAHEWGHALDHYFAVQAGLAKSEQPFLSAHVRDIDAEGYTKRAGQKVKAFGGEIRPEVAGAFRAVLEAMHRRPMTPEEVARRTQDSKVHALSALEKWVQHFRKDLERTKTSDEALTRFDAIAEKLRQGDLGEGYVKVGGQTLERNIAAVKMIMRDDTHSPSTDVASNYKGLSSNARHLAYVLSEKVAETSHEPQMTATTFARESSAKDGGKGGKPYWATPWEMFARSFETYIADQLQAQARENTFLSEALHRAETRDRNGGVAQPYPRNEDRPAIDTAIDKLVHAIESRPTDRGVALFRRGPESGGMSEAEARAALKEVLERTRVPIRVTESPADWPFEAPKDAKAAYHEGRIWVASGNMADPLDLERIVARHEVTHAGIDIIYGGAAVRERALKDIVSKNPLLRQEMQKWIESDGEDRAALYRENGYDAPDAERAMRVDAMDEALAQFAESGNTLNGWKSFIATIQKGLRAMGLHRLADWLESASNAEALAFVDEMRRATQGAQETALRHVATAFARTREEKPPLEFPSSATRSTEAKPASDEAKRPPRSPPPTTTLGNPDSWSGPEASRFDSIVYDLQDKHVDTKRVVAAIEKAQRSQLADASDPYLQEELFHGRSAKAVQDFLDEELKPLLKDMATRGMKIERFEEWLQARHATERNVQIAKVNPELPDGGSGMTNAEARAVLGKARSDGYEKAYQALAKRVDAVNDATRQLLVSYGLEEPATVAAWKAAYQHYVPLQREDMESGGMGIGQGFSVRGSQKRATGSTRKVVNILANIALQRERTVVRGEKNRVANALVGLAIANPNQTFWRVDLAPTVKSIDPNSGLVTTRIDPLWKSRENVIVARTPDAVGNIVEHAVVFNQHDPRAARMALSLKNLDVDQLGSVLGFMAKMTRFMASMSTQYNPVFGVVNLTRDAQEAMLNLSTTAIAGKQTEVLGHIPSALRGVYADLRAERSGKPGTSTWAHLFEEFQKEGGKTGFRQMFATSEDRAEALKRELAKASKSTLTMKTIGPIADWLSDYNEAMENAVRLSAYKVGVDSGLSKARAASIAKNLTVNFNRKGARTAQLGAAYAFFNANVQGSARTIETLVGPAGAKIIAGGVLVGVLQAVALSMAGFDDDEPPEFVREKNLIIPIGGKRYVSIPMSLGFLVLPNVGRVATEYVLRGFKNPGKRMGDLLGVILDAFSPLGNVSNPTLPSALQFVAPTVLDPLAALATNQDWNGRPIAREDFNKLHPTPGYTRAKDTATGFSKVASRAINALTRGTAYKPGAFSPTPDQIDYLIGQVTGGTGREVSKGAQTASALYSGEDVPPYKIPLLGRFYGNADASSAQSSKFYDNLQEIAGHGSELKGRRQHGEPVAPYIQENPDARLVGQASYAEREVAGLRRRRSQMLEKGAPREEVKAMEDRINRVMTRFNDRVREARQ